MEENKIESEKKGMGPFQRMQEKIAKLEAENEALKAAKVEKSEEVNDEGTTPSAKSEDGIVWFTEVDLSPQGKVMSDFPAWYFDTSELKEEIRITEEQLADNVYQGKRKRETETKLKTMQDRLNKIENGKPKLSGPAKDKVVKSMRELGDRIKDSMFSYDSHWKQTADPHIVAERMVTPCIEIKDESVASFAKQRGFRIENGKVSQNDASIIFKSMAKLIGEPSDTDQLRPMRSHGITI